MGRAGAMEPGRGWGHVSGRRYFGSRGNSSVRSSWKHFSISAPGTAVPVGLADSGHAPTVHLSLSLTLGNELDS